ncbi:MAG: cytochrome c peroxidase [Woeseiaceae bacterium]
MMKPSFRPVWAVLIVCLATPATAQFLEEAPPPPPSAKDLELPVIVDTISGLDVVDEATGDGANGYVKDLAAAVTLGKALFWDMQVGSDGVACATCHYHAGADARDTNQLSPGIKGGNAVFDPMATGNGGANYTLATGDFPLHQLADPSDRESAVLFDTDDVVSSQGTFSATFNDVTAGAGLTGAQKEGGRSDDNCNIVNPDPFGFHVNNINVRRVEPRNTPTIINAAFNHRNFWDGRANNIFNGVDPFGQRNTGARVLEDQGGSVVQIQVAFENGSLASQSVGPPTSDFEMACSGRNFMKVGKKMVTAEALAGQKVHPKDSVLGGLSNHPKQGLDGPGNNGIQYADLIEAAISDRFWDSNKLFDVAKNEIGTGAPANTDEYTLMEANFSLIWGLAIQEYLRTLISDDAPYDQWAEDPGNDDRSTDESNGRGILTTQQMRGMELFFTNNLNLSGVGPKTGLRGNCSTCHQGPLFSTATFPFTKEEESGEFEEQEMLIERMRGGDAVNVIEDLLRYFVSGTGNTNLGVISGTAGSRELPSTYTAAVGGDITFGGSACRVTSFLMNQDRTLGSPDGNAPGPAPDPNNPADVPRVPPPEPPGPSDHADYSTKDAVFRLSCSPFAPDYEITIVDNGPGLVDTITVGLVVFEGAKPPFPGTYPYFFGAEPVIIPQGGGVGDFTLEIPVLYDTAFYNIGVRPTAEDPGVAALDPFGVPLSFTQQWIDQLLGTPAADVDAIASLNFARVFEPFNWYGDSVWFPGGLAGYAWLTHRLEVNPNFGQTYCALPGFPPGRPAPGGPFPDQGSCEGAGFVWFTNATEFNNNPQFFPPRPGRGDDAVPAVNPANMAAIASMPTAVDGAFKVPHLRNVSLTAPFFHNGGQLTLEQVVEFYNRGGDFAVENLGDLAPNIHPLLLDGGQIADIAIFMESFTDERVNCEQAPFDHPEIRIANGARGTVASVTPDNQNPGQSKDQMELIQATGADGRPANFAPCIDQENFLQ